MRDIFLGLDNTKQKIEYSVLGLDSKQKIECSVLDLDNSKQKIECSVLG